MPPHELHFTAIAGEHYVAHKLAMLGFLPAIVRQGIRSMDLLVISQDGSRSVAVQVESAASAMREAARGAHEISLQFPLSHRSLEQAAENTIFCFVDLQARQPRSNPDVYVMTARELRRESSVSRLRKYSYLRYIRPAALLAPFRNNWQPFFEALVSSIPEASEAADRMTPIARQQHRRSWELAALQGEPV